MGLFSSKKIYNAYAGSSSLYEEQPATLKRSMLQTAIGNEGTYATCIRYVLGTDVHARVKAMMRYAARYDDPTKDGGYIRGYPSSNMDLLIVAPEVIEAALTRNVGAWDNIQYTLKGTYNEEFFLYQAVQTLYTDTSYFAWSKGLPTDTHWDEFREIVPLPVVNPDTGDYYTASGPIEYSRYVPFLPPEDDSGFVRLPPEDAGTKYEVSFPYVDKDGVDQTYNVSQLIDIGSTVINYSWIMTAYDLSGLTYYWTYQLGSGADPTLETAVNVETREAQFLPVAVLMQDKVWFNENPDSELAITTNKLIKKMGTTGDEIREDFEETEAEASNKDNVGEKWDFFVHFAIPIDSQVRGALEYFWQFFTELDNWSTYDTQHYYDYLGKPNTSQPINELVIKEAGVNGYHVAYRWSYIHKKDFSGEYTYEKKIWDRLPDPDDENDNGEFHYETTTLKGKEVTSKLYQREEVLSAEYQDTIDDMFGPGTPVGPYNDPDKEKDDDNGYHDFYIITRQNPEDPDNPGVPQGYQRMLVMGLSMQYTINTRVDPNKKGDYRYRYATPQLFGEAASTKEFRLPILWGALQEIPALHREEACAEGFCATVFLVDVTKVPWYQKTFFKWLIVIIAVVLIVLAIFWPPFFLVLKSMSGAIALALGGGTMLSAIVFTMLIFAMGFLISLAGATITDEFGTTAGLLFQIIATAAFFYAAGGFQNLGTTFNNVIASPGWATAVNFINAATPVYNMGFSVYQNRVMAGIESDMQDFLSTAREKNEMLKEAWAGIGNTPDWIDPMDLVNMFRRVGSTESAQGYYARTLNPNPGLLGIEAVTRFPEMAIELPKDLNETTVIDSMMQEFANQRGVV